MDTNLLRGVIKEQAERFARPMDLVERGVPESFVTTPKISVISGVRRSGKSTLLKQLSRRWPVWCYLNFEDERLLEFTARDFQPAMEIFLELFGSAPVCFFDEIQNVPGWEKFVSRLFEDGTKVFITGSNAKLLSSELATALTGRHLKWELYPFSFSEFLRYQKVEIPNVYTTAEKAKMKRSFGEYLQWGGFPEVLRDRQAEQLQQLYHDILLKDLLVRFKIRETKSFRELALYLFSNPAAPVSYNNLRKLLDFKSVTSVKNYMEFLEESYLIFSVSRFDPSLKKQIVNDKKIYGIDHGLINAVAFHVSENRGAILENIVFLELKRRRKEIYYYKGAKECDFLIREGRSISEAIQVSWEMTDPKTREREVQGLLEAMETYHLKSGLILTMDEQQTITRQEKSFRILPVWSWLLSFEAP